jgi:hypothetical protein
VSVDQPAAVQDHLTSDQLAILNARISRVRSVGVRAVSVAWHMLDIRADPLIPDGLETARNAVLARRGAWKEVPRTRNISRSDWNALAPNS